MSGVPYSSYRIPSLGQINNVQIDVGTLANDDVIKFSTASNTWVNGVAGGATDDLTTVLTAGNNAGSSEIDMNSNKIVNALDPINLQDVATKNYIDSILGDYMKQVKVERFTTSGTWVVPAGATYAVAHILGGGGGCGYGSSPGGDSSVAFASGTIIGGRGYAWNTYMPTAAWFSLSGRPNSGQGAQQSDGNISNTQASRAGKANDGVLIVAGADVVAASSIAIVIGAGGSGAGYGGSGYVWIEYY